MPPPPSPPPPTIKNKENAHLKQRHYIKDTLSCSETTRHIFSNIDVIICSNKCLFLSQVAINVSSPSNYCVFLQAHIPDEPFFLQANIHIKQKGLLKFPLLKRCSVDYSCKTTRKMCIFFIKLYAKLQTLKPYTFLELAGCICFILHSPLRITT